MNYWQSIFTKRGNFYGKLSLCFGFVLFITVAFSNQVSAKCYNVTSPGTIGYDQAVCSNQSPNSIQSLSLPSGGKGTIEYIWLQSTHYPPTISNSTVIPGANGPSYTPGTPTQTTYFRRCARRSGCSTYVGESNWVTISINPCCTPLMVSSNVTDALCGGYVNTQSCPCDGKMTNLSVRFNGAGGSDVNVWNKSDKSTLISSFSNVSTGDILFIDASNYNNGEFESSTYFEVVGASGLTSIHTSCSQQIDGMTFGDFTVVGYTDGSGNICNALICSGSIDITVNNGTPPYIYCWSNGANSEDLSNVCAGTYTLTVSDYNGCVSIETYTVAELPSPISISGTVTDATCTGIVNPMSCPCSGKMTNLTLLFEGDSGSVVNVFEKSDMNDLIVSFSNVNYGDILYVDASGLSNGEFESSTYFQVVGTSGLTSIHTSCSQQIDGLTFGDFTVVGYTDGSGNVCNVLSCDGAINVNVSGVTDSITNVVTTMISKRISDYKDDSEEYKKDGDILIDGDHLDLGYQDNYDQIVGMRFRNLNIPQGAIITQAYIEFTAKFSKSNTANLVFKGEDVDDASSFSTSDYDISSRTLTSSSVNWNNVMAWSQGVEYLSPDLSSIVQEIIDRSGWNGGNDLAIIVDGTGQRPAVSYDYDHNEAPKLVIVYEVAAPATSSVSYNWSNGATTKNLNNVCAGSYTLTVTDALGCTAEKTFTVTERPSTLALSISSTDTDCGGLINPPGSCPCSGKMTSLTVRYNGPDGADIQVCEDDHCNTVITTFNNVQSGDFLVVSASGLSGGDFSSRTYFKNLNTNVKTSIHTSCSQQVDGLTFGDYTVAGYVDGSGNVCNSFVCNGSADLTVAGGNPPYSFMWSNGETTEDIMDICPGQYTVTVTDGGGCSETISVTINEAPPSIVANITKTNAGCVAGSSTVCDVTNITSNQRVFWLPGFQNPSRYYAADPVTGLKLEEFNDGTAHFYGRIRNIDNSSNGFDVDLWFKDKKNYTDWIAGGGDVKTFNTTDDSTSWFYYVFDGSQSNTLSGFGALAGEVVTLTNKAGSNYGIQIGFGANDKTSTFGISTWFDYTGTSSGNGDINADLENCTSSSSNCNGSAMVNASGGNPPYAYQWSTGATTPGINNLCPGVYFVSITDSFGCSIIHCVEIGASSGITLSAIKTDLRCTPSVCDGSINVSASGGAPPYTYIWIGPGLNYSDLGPAVDSLCAGDYLIIVSDTGGCVDSITVTLTAPDPLNIVTASTKVTCFGLSDGSATVTVSGGTPAYNYLWDQSAGNQITPTATGLSAGNYSVTVTDDNGCTISATVNVEHPDSLTASVSTMPTPCFASCDGSATVTVSGGNGGFTYVWDDPANQTGHTATGLCPGTYNVTVTDQNGCTAVANGSVLEPDQIAINISVVNATCDGLNDGSASAGASGGTAPYSYMWDANAGNQTTATATGLSAGSYNITVTDANGCEEIETAQVDDSDPITLAINTMDATCPGFTDGSALVNASGGTSPYMYKWDANTGGQTTATATGLGAGVYHVIVTDFNGCTATANAKILEPDTILIVITGTNVLCAGDQNGSLSASANGGTAPYSYKWDLNAGSQTSATATGLAAGAYTVTVTDANGCTASESGTVMSPTPLLVSTTVTDVSCFGFNDGTATANASGGTPPYTYLWDANAGNQMTATATGLAAGTYGVIVTDANGCVTNGTAIVNQPLPLSYALQVFGLQCFGDDDASVLILASGGTQPYSYAWGAGTGNQTSQKAIDLSAGAYAFTVTDANGCSIEDSILITEPDPISLAVNTMDAICPDSANGSALVNATGGTPPFTYQWDANAGNQTTKTATGLAAGVYTVTVTDNNGCSDSINAKILEPDPIVITINPTKVSCFGLSDGSAVAVASGGTGPYTYAWSTGQMGMKANNLSAGTYSVTVTDNNSCTQSASVTINQPDSLVATAMCTPVSCFGAKDGKASSMVTGGTPPYVLTWFSTIMHVDTIPPDTFPAATGLGPQLFYGFVVDAKGCIDSLACVITEPAEIILNTSKTDVSCFGFNDGTATVSVTSGGIAPFSYLWDANAGNQTTATATGLSAGSYSVTVTDADGCTKNANVTVNQPQPLTTMTNSTPAACFGDSTGSAMILVSGGTPPYSYLWSNGRTSPTIGGIPAGNYSVTVTDANGCTATDNVDVNQPSPVLALVSKTDATCYNFCDGTATVTGAGGIPPYTYLWENGATTNTITGLCVGMYSVTVTDANGCTASGSVTIDQPTELLLIATSTSTTCFGFCDGTADVLASGGTPPYTYNWSSGDSTSSLSGLCAGVYTVTVIDANNCTSSTSVTVDQPAPVTVSLSKSDVSCAGDIDGSINATASGGTPPYTYMWSTGDSSANLTGLPAGTYFVTATDANGCTGTNSTTINEPDSLVATAMCYPVSCFGAKDGSATSVVTGGTPPYILTWFSTIMHIDTIPPDTFPAATGLGPQLFYGFVVDANGCTDSLSCEITEPAPIVVTTIDDSVQCSGGNSGSVTAIVSSGGIAPFTYLWDTNAGNQTTATATGLAAGDYNVTVTDANGCTGTATGMVMGPNALMLQVSCNPVSCFGDTDGSATANLSGGTPPYSLAWSNGDSGVYSINNLAPGSYSLTVVDANGCIIIDNCVVGEPDSLVVTATCIPVTCFGSKDGKATSNITGGTQPYIFTWFSSVMHIDTIPPDTLPSATGLGPGLFTGYVVDARGCTDTLEPCMITEPAPLLGQTSSTPVSCFGGSDGTATVSPSGGNGNYTYMWSNGASTQTVTGLSAGTYSVTTSDSKNCICIDSVVVSQPDSLVLIATCTPVTCFGSKDGTASSTLTGGTPPYIITYFSSQTYVDTIPPGILPSASNQGPQMYRGFVVDANGCIDSAACEITEPDPLVGIVSSTNVSCFGGSDGTATVSAVGGNGNYSYNWSTGATTATITGLSAGVYVVTTSDQNGCICVDSAVITQPDSLIAIATCTPVSCFGSKDGTAMADITGGTAPFILTYFSSQMHVDTIPPDPFPSGINLAPGFFYGYVVDANGCIDSLSCTITEPDPLLVTVSSTPASCFGGSDGTASASPVGGNGNYTYMWSNGATTQTATGLSAGTYSVTTLDSKNCVCIDSVVVAQPTEIQISFNVENVNCFGESNGSVSSSVFGGTPPYTYAWSNSSSGNKINGIPAGSYSLTVTDANGCSMISDVTVTQPDSLVALAMCTPVSCFGAKDGTASAVITGGSQPYIFTWYSTIMHIDTIPPDTFPAETGLGPQFFYGFVVDDNGCLDSLSCEITEPDEIILSSSSSDASCNGFSDGSATVSVASGGIPPFSYQWDANAGNQTTATATGLSAGTYSVTVTDATNCSKSISATVGEPTLLTATTTSTMVSCNGFSDGTATANPSGGTTPYSYQWDLNAGSQTTKTATGLAAGAYSVTVTDANGCIVTAGANVLQPTVLTSSTSSTSVSCNGGSDGTTTASASGGTAPYTYIWDANAGSQTTATATGLSAGTYSVTVTDANGCSLVDSETVTQPTQVSGTISRTPVSCNGGSDGTASVSITGGTPPYTCVWSTGDTTNMIMGLSAGTYSVTCTDANGCSISTPINILEPTAIQLSESHTDVSCNGGSDGSAIVLASGGTPPYTYAWPSPFGTSNSASGLSAGTYTVTVTDANGCVATIDVTIGQPDVLDAVATCVPVTCFGAKDGSATSVITGGTQPYILTWFSTIMHVDTIPPDSFPSASGLGPQMFYGFVTDAKGCTDSFSCEITQPDSLYSFNSVTNVTVNGGTDGSIDLMVIGGTQPYSYLWSNGATTEDLDSITAGIYVVTVTDANGCMHVDSMEVLEPSIYCNTPTEVPHVLSIVTGNFASEIGWVLLNNSTGDTLSNTNCGTLDQLGEMINDTVCLEPTQEYCFIAYDDWGDGWNGGTYTLSNLGTGSIVDDGMPNNGVDGDEVGGCNGSQVEADTCFYLDGPPVFGCTDMNAVNYTPSATLDDGSCLYDITFTVDMNCMDPLVPFSTVYVTGPLVGFCGNCLPLVDQGGGIWSNTFQFPAGTFEYKYIVDNFASQENLIDDMQGGASCAPVTDFFSFANRTVEIGTVASVSETYGSCSPCGSGGTPGCTDPSAVNYDPAAGTDDGSCQYNVTFNVDMNCSGETFSTVALTGPFCSFCGSGFELTDPDNDGIYSGTFVFGSPLEYKYIVDGFASQEDLVDDMVGGASCAPITNFFSFANRLITFNSDVTIDNTYGSCSPCPVAPDFCPSPENLLASNMTASKVTLSWDPVPGAVGYSIRGNASIANSPDIEINPYNGTSLTINSDLVAGIEYYWQVAAICNGSGDTSEYSSRSTFTLPTCDAPSPIGVTNITATTATLNWTPKPNALKYVISGRIVPSSNIVTLNVNNPATSSLNVTQLSPSSTYQWTIQSVCNGSASDIAPVNSFTTLAQTAKQADNGIDPNIPSMVVSIFPNPNDGQFQLDVRNMLDEDADVFIYNVLGQEVFRTQISPAAGDRSISTIELKEAGTYMIRVISENGSTITERLIVQ